MRKIIFTSLIGVVVFSSALSQNKGMQEQQATIISSEKRAYSVYLTKNHQNNPVIAWTEEDANTKQKYFFYGVSKDNGKTFPDYVEIPVEQEIKLHSEGMPKVAFRKNGEVYAMYEVSTKSEINPRTAEIHYKVSKDNGKTWSSANRVHKDNTPDKAWSFFDVTVLNDGELGVCWLDNSTEKGGRPVKFAHTNSEGRFVQETIVDSIACQCCRTAISTDAKGNIVIVYRDIISKSIRDISVSVSSDHGQTFSQPVCFSADNWMVEGCPHNGPDVMSDGKNIFATWFTGAEETGVYYGKINFNGQVLKKERVTANGRNIQLALLPNGNQVLVYNEQIATESEYYSPIFAKIQPGGKPVMISEEKVLASLPVVSVTDENHFLVAWIQEVNGKEKVLMKVVGYD